MATAAVVVSPCRVADIRARPDLLDANSNEVEGVSAAPDWDRYVDLEAAGVLQCLGVFQGQQMLAYSVCVVGHGLNHERRKSAKCLAIYASPAARLLGLGLMLMAESEREARSNGACEFFWTATPGSRMATILDRRKYAVAETVYRKEL